MCCPKLFLVGLFTTLPFLNIANVITLRKEHEITCVISQPDETPIFLNPPIKTELKKTPNEFDDWNWNKNNWFSQLQDVSAYSLITDERWQDFKTFETSDQTGPFYLDDKPIPLSVYVNKNITFKVISKGHHRTFDTFLMAPPNKKWFNFILRREDNHVQILSENRDIIFSKRIDFNGPYWISIITPTYYKLHEPEYWWSSTPTNGQRESYINVSLSEDLCISMYVSLDVNSFLNITLETHDNAITEFASGFNQKNTLKKWEKKKICADSPGPARLFLNRMNNVKNDKYGYWAVSKIGLSRRDIQIYHVNVATSHSGDHRCEMLNQPNNITYDIDSIMHTPGFLGNMSCVIALGSSYPFCEHHKISLGESDWFCSWGYQGPSCDRTCDEGYYGLFCIKRCVNCTRCVPSTGACLEEEEQSNTSNDVAKNEISEFYANKTSVTSEETTLSGESGGDKSTILEVTVIKNQENNKVGDLDGNISQTSNFASITAIASIALVFSIMCAIIVLCTGIVWYFKHRNHPTSNSSFSAIQIGESSVPILGSSKNNKK